MTHSFLRGGVPSLALAALLGYLGCSTGTNTGNGMDFGSGGASNTGGTPSYCLNDFCAGSVEAIASDGATYRGKVFPDFSIASSSDAQSVINPPVAELRFDGEPVVDSTCRDSAPDFAVEIFLSTADSSIDDSGTLHVHAAPRDDLYAAGPVDFSDCCGVAPGWAVDLTVTAEGQLSATLTLAPSSSLDADTLDAGEPAQELKISGPLEPSCLYIHHDGVASPASIPVSGGGVFNFPCWQRPGCGDWGG